MPISTQGPSLFAALCSFVCVTTQNGPPARIEWAVGPLYRMDIHEWFSVAKLCWTTPHFPPCTRSAHPRTYHFENCIQALAPFMSAWDCSLRLSRRECSESSSFSGEWPTSLSQEPYKR